MLTMLDALFEFTCQDRPASNFPGSPVRIDSIDLSSIKFQSICGRFVFHILPLKFIRALVRAILSEVVSTSNRS
ncbi:hypothetical protein GJ496_003193 [Pomphorhynchus laevis]|nr:hypothetical protein GJ496_003193 [Pomphorhynchus laevis]